MDDVARACGISKKTLYSMFANKYELVETLIAGITSWFSTSYNEVRKSSADAIDEVFGTIKIVEPLYRKMHYRMFDDLERHYYQVWRKVESFKIETGLELISGNIRRGIQEGLFADRYDINIMAEMRLNQLDMIHRQTAEKGSLYTTLHQTTEHYLRGLATANGIKRIDNFSHTSTIITDNKK